MLKYENKFKLVRAEDETEFDEACDKLASEGWVQMSPAQAVVRTNEHGEYMLFFQQWQKVTPTFKYIMLTEKMIDTMISDLQQNKDIGHGDAAHRISQLSELKAMM